MEKIVRNYFIEQENWTNKMIEQFGTSDPFWRHVSYVNAQLDGLHEGYKTVAPKQWVRIVLYVYMVKLTFLLCEIVDLL